MAKRPVRDRSTLGDYARVIPHELGGSDKPIAHGCRIPLQRPGGCQARDHLSRGTQRSFSDSVVPKGCHGVHLHRPACGNVAGNHGGPYHDQSGHGEGSGVGGAHLEQQFLQQPSEPLRGKQTDGHPC